MVAVVAMAPSISQGTVTIRMYGYSGSSLVTHLYVGFTNINLHEAGFLNGTGWVTITKGLSTIDLASRPAQAVPQIVSSTLVHSGRYDGIAVIFSNSTLVVGGRSTSIAPASPIRANVTLPVPPNSNGDIFLVVSFDYGSLFSNPPTLSLTIVQILAV